MKLKYVAMINIMGIIFSSFSPVFADTQSDILAEREKRVKEQAVSLSDKSVNLDDKEKELNRKKAELDDFEKRLHDDKVQSSVRAKEIDDKLAKLNYDSELLAAQNREFLKDKADFADYCASVENQKEEDTYPWRI